jgi:hypothetical protein
VYRVITDPSVLDQIDALPDDALRAYAEVVTVLEVAPAEGRPYNSDQPHGPMRQVVFGPGARGTVTYLLLEREREVHVLLVLWLS